jgi:hypothetical protein
VPIRITDLRSDAEIIALANGYYVKLIGDTMSGDLTLPTLYATDAGFSEFNGGIIIKSGQKLIFDGA